MAGQGPCGSVGVLPELHGSLHVQERDDKTHDHALAGGCCGPPKPEVGNPSGHNGPGAGLPETPRDGAEEHRPPQPVGAAPPQVNLGFDDSDFSHGGNLSEPDGTQASAPFDVPPDTGNFVAISSSSSEQPLTLPPLPPLARRPVRRRRRRYEPDNNINTVVMEARPNVNCVPILPHHAVPQQHNPEEQEVVWKVSRGNLKTARQGLEVRTSR